MRGIPGRLQLAVSIATVAVLAAACGTSAADPAPTAASPTTVTPVVEVLGTSIAAPPNDVPTDAVPTDEGPAAARVAPAAPATMLIVGDSGMVDLAPALEASFAAAGVGRVVNSAWPGFGLTRSQFVWRDEWRRVVATERPSIVVVMLGGWDLRYIDEHGTGAYGRLVEEALEVLMADGARVEWLAMLPGGGSYLPIVNAVYAGLSAYPGAVDFYDAQGPLRSPDGSFLRTVPTLEGDLLVRKPDHWHFCPDGAALVADAVHTHLTELGWLPAATPGWQSGPWRDRADIYDNPVGACDAPAT